jgi:Ca2+-binding EF-hand superfamily protein
MAVAFVIVSQPREAGRTEPVEPTPEYEVARLKYLEFIDQKANEFTDDFFARLDADRDGKVSMAELPRSTRRFGRDQMDANQDGVITREEIHQKAQQRFGKKFPKEKFDPVLSSD